MTYTDVFGGNLIFPSRVSYLALETAIDLTLQWPTEQQITGDNVVADIIDTNTTAPALNIDMPDSRNTGLGNKATFNNVGGNTFTVRDNTGGTIQSVQPGEQWIIVLTDNSTQAGLWTTFLLGGNAATPASASVLAGDGLRANGAMLDQIIDSDVESSTPFTVVEGDRAKCLIYTAGAGTCNLPSPGAVGNSFFFMLRNSGSGTLNIVPPSGDIDGGSSINLDPNDSCFIFTDGVDFFTIGLTLASTIAFDFVSLAVPGSGDFVLSGANLNRIAYRFTGALTGNRRIVVPTTTQQYWADNQTTNAFTLEVSTAAGAGIFVPQGQSVILYCDATDVVNATSSTSVAFPITIGQGGTGATTAAGARINLNAAFDGILIETQADSGLAGGSDLTANVVLLLDVDNLVAESSIDTAADFLAVFDADAGAMRKFLIDDVVPSPDSLIDSGSNVRAFAATSGVLQLRSDANGDALIRRLNFTHQDGTIALFIGQTSFSEEMFISNNINNADADMIFTTANANAIFDFRPNSVQAFHILASGPVVKGPADNTAQLRFGQSGASPTIRATVGYRGSNNFDIDNGIISGEIHFFATDSGSSERLMCEMNPNADVKFYHNPGGGAIEVARTLDDGDGGFEVNNLQTGAGFERVLTESDTPNVVQEVKTANEAVVGSTTYQNDNHLINMDLVVGRWGISGFFEYAVSTASAGFKFRFTRTGGAFSGSPYMFTYRADTGASPSNADTYFTTLSGVIGALITTLQTGEGVGFLNGNTEIITSTLTLTTQWAQVVATGTTTFGENSWLRFTRTDT